MSDKWSEGIRAGAVDVSIPVLLRDVDDNLEVTGKVFGDVTASYWRQGGLRVAITPATLAAVNSAHSDGGFKEVDATNQAGLYRFDLPDAAVATGADWVVVTIKVAGCFVFHERFELTTDPLRKLLEADLKIDKTVTPWAMVWYERGTATELLRKRILDVDAANITSTAVVPGQFLQ